MVPEGWQTHAIGEVAKVQVGRDVQETRFSEERTNRHVHPVYSNTVDQQGLYGFYDFEEYPGDAVTVVGRGIGLGTAFYKDRPFGAIGRLVVLHPRNGGFYPRFLADYINHRLRIFNESGGIPQLPGSSLAAYKVTLPPLPEQRKIADILSTWDRAIETTEALLATARTQKRALMQSLLTGKRRFPEFEGQAWVTKEFGDAFTTANDKKTQVNKRAYLDRGRTPVVDQGKAFIVGFTDHKQTYDDVPVVIFGDHTREVKWVDFSFCPGADGTQLLKTKPGLDLKFGYYLLEHLELPNLGYSRHMRELKQSVFEVPVSLDEQSKIVAILDVVDDEIRLLAADIDKLRTEKTALMQQLLTGKRRVVVEDQHGV